MQGKWREFKFDMGSARPLDKCTALEVELYSKDHICFNDKGYSDHFIEYEAYTHLKAENEKLEHTLREYKESVAKFVQGNPDVATALPDCFGKNCGVVLVEYTKKIQEQNKKLKAALEKIAKPTFGTEWTTMDKENYEENYEIICRHFFSAQKLARTTLAEIGGDENG